MVMGFGDGLNDDDLAGDSHACGHNIIVYRWIAITTHTQTQKNSG